MLSPDRLQVAARHDSVRRRDAVRQLEELRRTLRLGSLIVAPILLITGLSLAIRFPTRGADLFVLWASQALAVSAVYPLAKRVHRQYIVRLTLLLASLPMLALLVSLALEPAALLSMLSGYCILPVAVPLFFGWSRPLRTAWLVAYGLIMAGTVVVTGLNGLVISQRTDMAIDIAIGCLIGWIGGELLERPRLRTIENELELRRLNRVLSGYATTDPLTDLSNRRRLETDLGLLAVSLRQSDAPCAVLMFDVDRFKQINDELGHAAGDAALQSVAAELKHVVRGRDTVYRYGGEEFVVILPDANLAAGIEVAERIRRAIEGLAIRARPGPDAATLTVSGGVAVSLPPHGDWDAALRVADFALYDAKTSGRNRICSATTESMNEALAEALAGNGPSGRAGRPAWVPAALLGLRPDEGIAPA